MTIFRPEHPKPQFRRDDWLNLNGVWKYAFDFDLSSEEKSWPSDASEFRDEINVPFCPESRLSGVEHKDFIPAIWYHREFSIPDGWAGKMVFLNFGAVDYDCQAWVNGRLAGRHLGGGASFSFEITDSLQPGVNSLVVCARDDTRSRVQPGGKQSHQLNSYGCMYTRTTGIWQTVWLEARPQSCIELVRITPDLDSGYFLLTPVFYSTRPGAQFRATALFDGQEVATGSTTLDIPNPRPWSPEDPFLYDLRFELIDGEEVIDTVHSYAGLRKFHIEGNKLYLNNKPIFLRFVLDQGFYPDGIWTAPSDEALKADIEMSMAVGFNGARLHQKVFEERFHYWADKLGYLTWGEYCDWGIDFCKPEAVANHLREWKEVVPRDANHPSILAWTPFNETASPARDHPEIYRSTVEEVVAATRALDPSRPVNDASGYAHVITDIYTEHDYEQDPAEFGKHYQTLTPASVGRSNLHCPDMDAGYQGQPYVVDEYGGTWWAEDAQNEGSWGYGKAPVSIEEVYARIEELTKVLTDHPHIAGFCYTQLTDVEQEQNGIYTYDRKPKFDAERLREIFGRPAEIEKEG